jgi:hypothetical protein
LALDSAATLPDKTETSLTQSFQTQIFKQQNRNPTTAAALWSRHYYCFRVEPLKIAKSASSSTPLQEQVASLRQQQNADQEVPRRTLNLLFFSNRDAPRRSSQL